jgi:hypothetical protein
VDAGAKLDIDGHDGLTPLDIAKANGSDERVFIQSHSCEGALTAECQVTVYHVPKGILFFAKARERPRLQGPKYSFSSGLLILQRIDYFGSNPKSQGEVLSLKAIETTWRRGPTRILELGSLVRLNP